MLSKYPTFILGQALQIVFNFILFSVPCVYVLHQTVSSRRVDTHLFLVTIKP